MHVPLWGPLFDRHERLVTDLRAALGDAAFAMAYDRGRRAKV
jgi:hypothetical protein